MWTWRGWTAPSASAVIPAPTWDEWCARQQRILRREKHQQVCQQDGILFSERELARLSFVRWLYQRGHLDPLDPAPNDSI
jgi:hypothetical protein